MKKSFKSDWALGLTLFLFALLFFSSLFDGLYLTIYQGRDLLRAKDLLAGQWIWHGPELSGGGALPGPFYYLLIALPLALFGSWQSVVWFMFVLSAAAATLLWYYGKKRHSNFCALLMYFAFLLASVVTTNLSSFWNPSFIFIFQVGLLLLLADFPKKPGIRLLMAGLLVGFSMQVHFIQVIFGLSVLVMIWLGHPLSRSDQTKMTLQFLSGVFVTLMPFLIWKIFFETSAAGSYSGGLAALLKPIGFSWDFANLSRGSLYQMLSSDVLFLPLIAGWVAYFIGLRKQLREVTFSRFLVATLLIATPVLLSNLFRDFSFRYFSVWLLIFYVLSAQLAEKLLERFPRWCFAVLLFSILFHLNRMELAFQTGWPTYLGILLCGSVLLLASRGFKTTQRAALSVLCVLAIATQASYLEKHSPSRYDKRNADREALVRHVISRTGWSYDEFRKRAYMLGLRHGADISAIYDLSYEKYHPEKNNDFDGVIVVHGTRPEKAEMPREISSFQNSGQIKCILNETIDRNHFCFYRFANRNEAVSLNNIGYAYRSRNEKPLFEVNEAVGVKVVDEWNAVLFHNVCSSLNPACTIFFEVSIVPEERVKFRVTGLPVSSNDLAVNPVWAASIREMKFAVKCGNKTKESVASRLGYSMPGPEYPSFLLAPYEHIVSLDCKSPSKIAVRALSGMSGFNNNFQRKLQPFELEWIRL